MEITVDQMYQIENKGHDMGFLKKFMMENAGAAAVRRLLTKFENVDSKNILIFVGMGNNGGDGLVMARHLAGYGSNVTVMLHLVKMFAVFPVWGSNPDGTSTANL